MSGTFKNVGHEVSGATIAGEPMIWRETVRVEQKTDDSVQELSGRLQEIEKRLDVVDIMIPILRAMERLVDEKKAAPVIEVKVEKIPERIERIIEKYPLWHMWLMAGAVSLMAVAEIIATFLR